MSTQHRFWLAVYYMGYRRFDDYERAVQYMKHHDEQKDGPAVLVGCNVLPKSRKDIIVLP